MEHLAKAAVSPAAILDSAPSALILVDTGGVVRFANRAAASLFGLTSEEFSGRPVGELVPERFAGAFSDHLRRFREKPETQEMSARADLSARTSNGREVPVEVLLNPIDTSEGPYVVAAFINLIERKRHEEDLRLANAALEKAKIECQQFAFIASHDLQTPLRGIAGFAQLLQSDYGGKLDSEADRRLERIVAGVKHMQELIDDMRSFTSVESRARPFEMTDLNAVFAQVLETLAPSIVDAGAQVTATELPSVACDRTQISQLLRNLIANAITYHGKRPPKIEVSAEQRAGEWVISVRDNGIGIEAKQHDNIFKMFRRLHSQERYPGTGIGLAICRRIAERHGGNIWLDSAPGEGSTFYFTIQRQRREAA